MLKVQILSRRAFVSFLGDFELMLPQGVNLLNIRILENLKFLEVCQNYEKCVQNIRSIMVRVIHLS